MSNVVRLASRQQYGKRTFTKAEQVLDSIREQIFADGRTYRTIANATGKSSTTIGNIASGKTKWPRGETLFPLIAALHGKLSIDFDK